MPKPYDQFILFGDSITQMSFDQELGFGFGACLQNSYVRRLDVTNRGLGGYNTKKALKVLPDLFPTVRQAKVRFVAICFGANDACLPSTNTGHHVPVAEYRQNMQKIVEHPAVTSHSPHILLITPPPVNEYQHRTADLQKGYKTLRRTAQHTKLYADACKDLGANFGIPVVDIWTAFLKKAGWTEGEPLIGSLEEPRSAIFDSFFSDGVHLLSHGQRIVFDEIIKVIREALPSQAPESLSPVFPTWEFAPE